MVASILLSTPSLPLKKKDLISVAEASANFLLIASRSCAGFGLGGLRFGGRALRLGVLGLELQCLGVRGLGPDLNGSPPKPRITNIYNSSLGLYYYNKSSAGDYHFKSLSTKPNIKIAQNAMKGYC